MRENIKLKETNKLDSRLKYSLQIDRFYKLMNKRRSRHMSMSHKQASAEIEQYAVLKAKLYKIREKINDPINRKRKELHLKTPISKLSKDELMMLSNELEITKLSEVQEGELRKEIGKIINDYRKLTKKYKKIYEPDEPDEPDDETIPTDPELQRIYDMGKEEFDDFITIESQKLFTESERIDIFKSKMDAYLSEKVTSEAVLFSDIKLDKAKKKKIKRIAKFYGLKILQLDKTDDDWQDQESLLMQQTIDALRALDKDITHTQAENIAISILNSISGAKRYADKIDLNILPKKDEEDEKPQEDPTTPELMQTLEQMQQGALRWYYQRLQGTDNPNIPDGETLESLIRREYG